MSAKTLFTEVHKLAGAVARDWDLGHSLLADPLCVRVCCAVVFPAFCKRTSVGIVKRS